MTAANRNRGAVTERMVVTWLRAHGWPDAERRLVTGHRTRSRTRPLLHDAGYGDPPDETEAKQL